MLTAPARKSQAFLFVVSLATLVSIGCQRSEPDAGVRSSATLGSSQPLEAAVTPQEPLTPTQFAARCIAAQTSVLGQNQAVDTDLRWHALISLADPTEQENATSSALVALVNGAMDSRAVLAECNAVVTLSDYLSVPDTWGDFPEDPIARSGACGQVLLLMRQFHGDGSAAGQEYNAIHLRLMYYEQILRDEGVDIEARKSAGQDWYRARSGLASVDQGDVTACVAFANGVRLP